MEASEFFNKWKIRILEFTKDNNLAVYFVFVVISFVLFYLHALGKEYTIDFKLPVTYENLPLNKERKVNQQDYLNLNISGDGFSLFRLYTNTIFSTYKVNAKELSITKNTNELLEYEITLPTVRQQIEKQFGGNIHINEILPKKIAFEVRTMQVKKIPVVPNIKIGFSLGYILKRDQIQTTPDSVLVRGDKQILDTLKSIGTEVIELDDIVGEFAYKLDIEDPKNKFELLTKNRKVWVKGEIVNAIKKEQQIKVLPINFPDSLEVTFFPKQVSLSYNSTPNALKNIKESDFRLIIDYNTISHSFGKLEVQALHLPDTIFNIHIEPRYVDYIIKRKQK